MIVPRWASFSGLIAISSTPIASAFIVTLVSISNNASSACAAAADALAAFKTSLARSLSRSILGVSVSIGQNPIARVKTMREPGYELAVVVSRQGEIASE